MAGNNILENQAGSGAYFTFAQQGTRNTGVTLTPATQTGYSATAGILCVVNTNAVGGPNIYMDYFQIAYDAVNTAGVAGQMYHRLDVGNLYSSGGAAMTGYNMQSPGQQPQGVLVYSGVLVIGAATANTRDFYKTTYINGVGAATPALNICLKYGADHFGDSSIAIPATTAQDVIFRVPPVVVAPGMSYIINEFQTSRSGAGTGEFYVGLTVAP